MPWTKVQLDILDQITDIVASFGYLGIAALMLLENVIPPIPSELIMPLAGFAAARGEMTLAGAIAAGTVGSVMGALLWYYIGYAFGLTRICKLADRYGRWLGISSEGILSVQQWFSRQGGYWAIGLGRLIPGIRTYISVPAGVTNMPFWAFFVLFHLGITGLDYAADGSRLLTARSIRAGIYVDCPYQQRSNHFRRCIANRLATVPMAQK